MRHEPVEILRGQTRRGEGRPLTTSVTMPTAKRNTSLPSMRRWPTVGWPMGRRRRGVWSDDARPSVDASSARAVGVVAGAPRRLQHDGAGAIAEQHASRTVGPIDDARKSLGPRSPRRVYANRCAKIYPPSSARRWKPSRTACKSKATPCVIPSIACICVAVEGKGVIQASSRDDDEIDIGRSERGMARAARAAFSPKTWKSSPRRRRCVAP